MKKAYFLLLALIFLIFSQPTFSQSFDGDWATDYVISDTPDNGPGHRVQSVTVLEENSFIALVNRPSKKTNYLVGYKNASYSEGRVGKYGYSSQVNGLQMRWVIGFDQEFMFDANDLTTIDDIIYVANNDENNHSILAFEFKEDSIYSYSQRYKTGNEYLWGIDNDASGRIYLLKGADTLNPGSVMILENPNTAPAWNTMGNSGTVLQEFSLPELGSVRGITVNENGSLIYVSNWDSNKVYCYIGDPINGYSLNENFNFDVPDTFLAPTSQTYLDVGPHGINYMFDKNILFVTHDTDYGTGESYQYGRIYLVNPNSGSILDSIDIAEWNRKNHPEGKYDDPDTLGLVSGYASVNNVDFDEKYNVYSQSYYGWSIDKRFYSTDLPTIELTIVGIEKSGNTIPNNFFLNQNYPNPFNPTTTIEFGIKETSEITLSLYSITGELVSNLISNKIYNPGTYKTTLNAENLASGTYIYQLTDGKVTISKKMIFLK